MLEQWIFKMNTIRPFELAFLFSVLMAGIFLFVRAWLLSDAVPNEFRSASPGFNWGWEYDYERAMQDPGKFGGEPWPWPATKTGNRIILPLNQPLITDGLEIMYRGMEGSNDFRLDIKIQNLDTGVTYAQRFSKSEARNGFFINDKKFSLEKITPRYIHLFRIQS
jgi:hypothetical protein